MRILATSSRDLWDEVSSGRFRLDLYFRLGVLGVRIPPLAERRSDLGLLAQTLARRGGHHGDVPPPTVTWLNAQEWPENLRGLAAWIDDELAGPNPFQGNVACDEGSRPAPPSFAEGKAHTIERFERAYVRRVLEAADGNVSLAARWARLDRRHLHRLLQRRRAP